jgi:GTPase
VIKPINHIRVLLLGRTNVGKSTLFNKLIGKRYAIEGQEEHLTRDARSYIESNIEWIDLPGCEAEWLKKKKDQPQWQRILQSTFQDADFCLWVVDGREGINPEDIALFRMLGKKPWIGVANKIDHEKAEQAWQAKQGVPKGEWHCVSASHKLGISNLKSAIQSAIATLTPLDKLESPKSDNASLRVAIVGRPNAGKSSFCNQALDKQRVRVSSISHTTRDVVEVPWPILTDQDVFMVDTAGMLLRKNVDQSKKTIQVSELQSKRAIERCEVAFFFVDAEKGIGQADMKIYRKLRLAYTTVIIVVNKWDLKYPNRVWESQRKAKSEIHYLLQSEHHVVFHSTQAEFNAEVFKRILSGIHAERHQKISTSHMNRWIQSLHKEDRFKNLHRLVKLKYATQKGVAPLRIYCFGKFTSNYSNRKKEFLNRTLLSSFIETFDIRYGPVFFRTHTSIPKNV